MNGIVTVPPTPNASSPAPAGHQFSVLVDFLIQLHSTNTSLVTVMFLQSWSRTVKEQYKWLAPLLARVYWNIQSTTDKFDGDRQAVGGIALFVSVFL